MVTVSMLTRSAGMRGTCVPSALRMAVKHRLLATMGGSERGSAPKTSSGRGTGVAAR